MDSGPSGLSCEFGESRLYENQSISSSLVHELKKDETRKEVASKGNTIKSKDESQFWMVLTKTPHL